MDSTTTQRAPWGRRSGFEDTTRRRVEVRMTFLGVSQRRLGELLGCTQQQVQQWMAGKRPWRGGRGPGTSGGGDAIDRFAAALRVPAAALEPGAPWEPLLVLPA